MNSDVEDLLSDVAERFEDVPDERLEARLHLINHVVGDLDTPARTRVVAAHYAAVLESALTGLTDKDMLLATALAYRDLSPTERAQWPPWRSRRPNHGPCPWSERT